MTPISLGLVTKIYSQPWAFRGTCVIFQRMTVALAQYKILSPQELPKLLVSANFLIIVMEKKKKEEPHFCENSRATLSSIVTTCGYSYIS